MGILYCDSFNSYGTTADMSKAWGSNSIPANLTLDPTGGTGGTPCAKLVGTGAAGAVLLSAQMYATPSGTVLGGRFKFKQSAITTASTFLTLGTQNLSGGTAGTFIMGTNGTTGTWFVTGNTTVNGTSNVCDNVEHLIEWQVDLKDSGGAIKVWVDGVLEINFSGDAFAGSAHATAPWQPAFSVQATGPVQTRWIDDFIIFDNSGGTGALKTSGQPFGNLAIATIRPTGAGSSAQFTPSAGANWECVDDVTQNGSTDYVQSATSGHRDLYAMGDLGVTPAAILGVVNKCYVENPGSGTISMQQVLKSGATIDVGTSVVAGVSGGYKAKPYDVDPNGSAAWTLSAVNALEAGFQVA